MKKVVFLLFTLFAVTSYAQESQTECNFLRVPMSAHSAALGGENISIIEDDASLIFSNPALLASVSSKTINLNYLNYMSGVNMLSAAYTMAVKERATVAASAQYVDYGTMKETSSEGVQLGDFHAKDMAFTGYFSYLLTDKITAGIAAKFITSYIGHYNSMAVGVDLGVNYYDPNTEWSISAVAKNLGGQIKPFEDDYEPIPLDVQIGVSKRLVHTPLRLNATIVDLTHWENKLKDHIALGADFIITNNIWVGCGYNFRRASEMGIGTGDERSSHGAGFSLGAGLNLERFKVNVAWGKYHVASNSLIINLAYNL